MRLQQIQHEFMEFIPQKLQPARLYISLEHATAMHLCCCGCGYEVSTPFTRTDWSLVFNGEAVSLSPSIGNSSFPCKSHYWIREGRVLWEAKMTGQLTAASRDRDKAAKLRRYDHAVAATTAPSQLQRAPIAHSGARDSWLTKLLKLLS